MSDGIIKKIQLPNGNIYDIQSEVVTDLGYIDGDQYDWDVETFLNTLQETGSYTFLWDEFKYFVDIKAVEVDGTTTVQQIFWGTEEGPDVTTYRSIVVENGEILRVNATSYLTFEEANSVFARNTHTHVRFDAKSQSIWDYCNTVAMSNTNPFVIYFDLSSNKTYVIETFVGNRQPVYKIQKFTEMNNVSYFCQRSSYYYSGSEHWGEWETYSSNGVTDVLVNNSSVVNNGIASLPAIPSKTSDLTNDSGFITGYTETDPTVPAWAKASTKPSYNFSEIGSTPTTISGYGLTDAYTKAEVDNLLLALPEPMLFKGSLGTGGTITTLPAAAAANEGFVYKVITDGIYASQSAKVGDTFISDGSAWVLIPSGDEPGGTVTSVGISNATNGGLSVSNSPITSSGTISIGHSNVLASAQTTSGIYPIKIDKNGHISEYGNAVTIPTKVSDLTNDAGYLTSYTETDPTVPSWAKASSKPSYTAAEVGAVPTTRTVNGKALSADITLSASDVSALPSSTIIPSKTSDLNNDSGFISEDSDGNINISRAYMSDGAYIGSYVKARGDTSETLSTTAKKIKLTTLIQGRGNAFTVDGTTSYGIVCGFGGTIQVSGKIRIGKNYNGSDIVVINVNVNNTSVYSHRYRVPPNMTTPAQDITLPTIPVEVSKDDIITIDAVNGTGARGTILADETEIYAVYTAPCLLFI